MASEHTSATAQVTGEKPPAPALVNKVEGTATAPSGDDVIIVDSPEHGGKVQMRRDEADAKGLKSAKK